MGENYEEHIEKIRQLNDEIREIHGSMKENNYGNTNYMSMLEDIDKEIIYHMDKIMGEYKDGDTSTE